MIFEPINSVTLLLLDVDIWLKLNYRKIIIDNA